MLERYLSSPPTVTEKVAFPHSSKTKTSGEAGKKEKKTEKEEWLATWEKSSKLG